MVKFPTKYLLSVKIVKTVLSVFGMYIVSNAQSQTVNFLLITADDLNWSSVGAYGNKVDSITPYLDKLASEGLRFEHGHVTIAVCQPSRQSLMTGRYPHNNGAPGFQSIADNVPILQEKLKAAGYLNGILGKAEHLDPESRFNWDMLHNGFAFGGHPDDMNYGRDPSIYYQFAKEFFDRSVRESKPFFLMANSHDPHRPFSGSNSDYKNPPPYLSRTYAPDEIIVPGFLPDITNIRTEMAQYFTSVHRADETVGGVLKALEDAGLAGNTLVMFLSDNGISAPFAKGNAYQNSTKTPWIVRWPGVVAPGRVDNTHFIIGIDFMPTILEAAGLNMVPNMDGKSFIPVLRGEEQGWRTSAFTEFNETSGRRKYTMRAIEDATFRYIYNAWSDGNTAMQMESMFGLTWKAMESAGSSDPEIQARVDLFRYRVPEELYDVKVDPDCLNNLFDDPNFKDELSGLKQNLANEMFTTADTLLPRFEALTGLTGEERKIGCMDSLYHDFDPLANRHDPGLCQTLGVSPLWKRTKPNLIFHFNGFTLPSGFEKAPLRIFQLNKAVVNYERSSSGIIRLLDEVPHGMYFVQIGSVVYKYIR